MGTEIFPFSVWCLLCFPIHIYLCWPILLCVFFVVRCTLFSRRVKCSFNTFQMNCGAYNIIQNKLKEKCVMPHNGYYLKQSCYRLYICVLKSLHFGLLILRSNNLFKTFSSCVYSIKRTHPGFIRESLSTTNGALQSCPQLYLNICFSLMKKCR